MTTFTFDRARERGTLGKVGQLNPLRRCVVPSSSHKPGRELMGEVGTCRFGIPEEIAQAALWLASGASGLRLSSS